MKVFVNPSFNYVLVYISCDKKKNQKCKLRYYVAAQRIPQFQSSVSRSGKRITCSCKNSCRPTHLEGNLVKSLTRDLYLVGQVS
jgi:hypothetical protein